MRHAEAVLLVDDDQAEPPEADGRFDEGMRADQHVDIPARQGGQEGLARAAPHASGQKAEADARRGQPFGEFRRVLLGEDLRRCHEGALDVVARRQEQGECGHDRLSAADVSLEQPRHGPSGTEVGGDLPHGSALGGGQLERQSGAGRAAQGLVGADGDPRPLPQARPLLFDARGEHGQFLAGQDRARRAASSISRGKCTARRAS